ncbi:MAG: UbiA family prenyltransferase [Candidatus Bathyarchaeota archaeon]|nr:UbiA family prenyltransferase [Candidatus Bathyarchaeota archaeon]
MAEAFVYVWCVLIGSLIASRGSPQLLPTVLAVLATLFIGLSVYIYNDITDAKMDRHNPKKKRRPLPSGKVSGRDAMSFVYLAILVGMILAIFTKLEVFLMYLGWLGWFLAYSKPPIRLKKKTFLKEGTPPIGLFLSVIIGAVVNGSVSMTVIFAGMFSALFIFFGLPAFRDTTDIKEDAMFGVKSLASILTWKQRLELVILFVLAIMTLTPLTYVNFGFNVIFPIAVVAMGFLVLRFLFPLLGSLEEKRFDAALRYMTTYFFLAQLSMVLASIPIIF